jgi:hypothetical protein
MSLYKPTSYSDAIGVLYGHYSEQTKPRILWSISLNCWAVTYNYDRDGLPLGVVKRFDDWVSAARVCN